MPTDDTTFPDVRDQQRAASLTDAIEEVLDWQRTTEYRLIAMHEDAMEKLRVSQALCLDSKEISSRKRQGPQRPKPT